MQYATVTLTWKTGSIHPLDELFASIDGVSIESIRYVSPVRDGEYIELLTFRGDPARVRTRLADSSHALEYGVSDGGDENQCRGVAYVTCRNEGLVTDLLAILRDHDIVLDWPIRYVEVTEPGVRGLELTVIGPGEAIQRAAATLPEEIGLEVLRLGEYDPSPRPFDADLTDRQREVFDVASRLGYYEIPRETTQAEVAAALDVATGTVGEHFRHIETKLASAYARGEPGRH
ncbi:helix-turn-helix domain-containing protein [Natronosalvus vescus]|uniref:helix-turn-helix domain-containing protein n=1 Tax=Natronosalvus vescus TaxID=2953881 RepID=UPI0020900A0C|nr:helix-turn-helix domain-containing protein [Natronosalvus vescus]